MALSISGQAYYVNKYTKESQWDMPTRPAEKAAEGEKVLFNVPDSFAILCDNPIFL